MGEYDPNNPETAVYLQKGEDPVDYEVPIAALNLGELISYLENLYPENVFKLGFSNAHSYRGFYEDLAFEPVHNVKVKDMLELAKSCVGVEFQGYRGGWFTMTEHTDVWLAYYGHGGGTHLSIMLLEGMRFSE